MAVKGIGRPLTILLRADTDGLAKGLQSAESKLQAFGKKTEVAARRATFALAGIGAAAFTSVQSASDLNESISKSEVIFGDSAKSIQNWAKTTDTALGLSTTAALEASGNFAILGSSAGLTGNDLASFAKDLTGLAADLASFNNTSTDEAIVALAAGLRGESEPLRRFGVLLSESAVQAKAMELGLARTTKELTNQDKVLARNELILEQTTKQQGDFARTAEGAANQQRILAATIENTKAELGQGLLPVYQDVLASLIPAVKAFSENSKQIVTVGKVAAAAAVSIIALNAAVKLSIISIRIATTVAAGLRLAYLTLAAATGSARAAQLLAELTYKNVTIAARLYTIALGIQTAALKVAELGVKGLTRALLLNPFTAVAVLAIAAGVAINKYANSTDRATRSTQNSNIVNGQATTRLQAVATATGNVGIASTNAQGKIGQVTTRLEAVTTAANNATIALVKTSAAVSNTAQESRDATRSAGRNASTYVSWTTVLKDYDIQVNNVSTSTKGLTKAQKEADKAAEKAAEKAKEQAKLEKEKAKALAETQKALAKATKAAEKIASGFAGKLETAKSALNDVKQAFNGYRDSVKSAITSQFSFEKAFETKGKNSFIESLKAQADAAKDFGAKIAKLVSLGLSRGGLDQIIQAGADVGGKIADELIAGGPGSIQNVNELVKSVDSVAGQIAKSTAGAFFDAGIEQGKALVAGIIQAAKDAGLIYSGGTIKIPSSAAGITNVAARNASASGLATTGSALGGAGGINITINGAIDPEGTRRALERLFQNSARRTGAVSLVGSTL